MLRQFHQAALSFFHKADLVLLGLCVAASIFGIVIIASATAYLQTAHFIKVQAFALLLGVAAYVAMTFLDIDIIAERWELLLLLSLGFIAILRWFGSGEETGNRSWLYIRMIGLSIQPAEICKIPFVIILSKVMSRNRTHLSTPLSVGKLVVITGLLAADIAWASSDDGLAITYLSIFAIMALAGGVSLAWFGAGLLALAAAIPFVWNNLLDQKQQNRILIVFDPSVDPLGLNERYQMNLCRRALGGGGLTGQGLGQGIQTQSGVLGGGQRTDYIFTVVGEELGMVGCFCVLALLCAIILRCIWVGVRAESYINRVICLGFAGMLLFQVFINVGMCLGLVPIIGLTLPFFSYGGSSLITSFLCMGIVSGIRMRPAPDTNVRYIRAPI